MLWLDESVVVAEGQALRVRERLLKLRRELVEAHGFSLPDCR